MRNYVLKYEYEIPEMNRTAAEKIGDCVCNITMAVKKAISK